MFGQHKVELFGETLMSFNILLSYKGSAVLIQAAPNTLAAMFLQSLAFSLRVQDSPIHFQ